MIGSEPNDVPIPLAARERGDDAPTTLPLQPRDDGGPVFREPWEAQAFAMALALHHSGLFSWKEWTEALAAQIAAAQAAGDRDLGDTYYRHWLAALETIVAAKGAGTPRDLERHRRAWERAAHRTPHSQPIVLKPADFRD